MDYAHVLKELVDIHFANAKTIVQDNLNIHSKASLYEAFPAAEVRRLVTEAHNRAHSLLETYRDKLEALYA